MNTVEHVCPVCEKKFLGDKCKVYCSDKCKNHGHYLRQKKRSPIKIYFCICPVCDETFFARSKGKKYCSDKCEKQRLKSAAIEKREKRGLTERQKVRLERNKKIVELSKQMFSNSEIAESLDIKEGVVQAALKAAGIYGQHCSEKRIIQKILDTKKKNALPAEQRFSFEYAKEYVESRTNLFEYVEGFTGADGTAVLRCRECGNVSRYFLGNLRRGRIAKCPVCAEKCSAERNAFREAEAEEKEKKKKSEAEKRKAEAKKRAQEAEKCRLSKIIEHTCPVCGKKFFGYHTRVYCSKECSLKKANSYHKDKRVRKLKSASRGETIILSRLVDISNGVCAICGGKVDYNDFHRKENGAFVAHDLYPSIDHIIPLCAGGTDTWDNVQLAHRSCNTNRYWKNKRDAYNE